MVRCGPVEALGSISGRVPTIRTVRTIEQIRERSELQLSHSLLVYSVGHLSLSWWIKIKVRAKVRRNRAEFTLYLYSRSQQLLAPYLLTIFSGVKVGNAEITLCYYHGRQVLFSF